MNTTPQKNTTDTLQEKYISDMIEQILAGKMQQGVDAKLLQTQINNILSDTKSLSQKSRALKYLRDLDVKLYHIFPDQLKRDRDIVLLALREGFSLSELPVEFQQDQEMLTLHFENLLEAGTSLYELTDFLKSIHKRKKLYGHLREKLRSAQNMNHLCLSELESGVLDIYFENSQDYSVLGNSGIFILKAQKIELSPGFIKQILELSAQSISDETTPGDDILLSQILELFQNMKIGAGAKQKRLGEIIHRILLPLWNKKKCNKTKNPSGDTKDGTQDETQEKNHGEEPEGIDHLSDVGNFLGYSRWDHAGYTTIQDSSGYETQLETRTLRYMSETSLEKYFRFARLLQELQLDFLLKKHASKIMIATQVDFYNAEGMTEGKILKFLNSIGKNIGIPEENYEGEDGEKKVGCFSNLESAKKHFGDIKTTGFIAGTHICSPADRGDHAIVEIALKIKGSIIPPYWELSLAHWK